MLNRLQQLGQIMSTLFATSPKIQVEIVQKLITNRHNYYKINSERRIRMIVLHTEGAPRPIEGNHDRSLYTYFQGDHFVSSHYYVTFSGKIEQYVLDRDIAYHARDYNSYSIGIEHQDSGYFNDDNAKYTDAQYEASARLIASLCEKYTIPIEIIEKVPNRNGIPTDQPGILLHRTIASKKCPGALDYKRIILRVKEITQSALTTP